MPLYEYRCPECEVVDEVFRNLDERDEPLFCKCWRHVCPACANKVVNVETRAYCTGAAEGEHDECEMESEPVEMERIDSAIALGTREPITQQSRMPKYPPPKWT